MNWLDSIRWLLAQHKLNSALGEDQTSRELLPKFLGKAKQNKDFQEEVEGAYTLVPDILRQLIGTSPDYKIQAAETMKEAEPSAGKDAIGSTSYWTGTVGISDQIDPSTNRSTTIHELGHVLDQFSGYFNNPEYRDAWLKEANKTQRGLYGATNSQEGIAELLTTLILKGKPRLEDQYSSGGYPQEFPKSLKITDKNLKALIKQLQSTRKNFKGIPKDWAWSDR